MAIMQTIILIGCKTAGKTTLGKQLAETLACPFVDTDTLCLNAAGASNISDLYTELGETGFRALEAQVVRALIATPPAVIATGGGLVVNETLHPVLQQLGWIIFLDVPAAQLWLRIQQLPKRPRFIGAVAPEQDFHDYYHTRRPLYQSLAHITVSGPQIGLADLLQAVQTCQSSAN